MLVVVAVELIQEELLAQAALAVVEQVVQFLLLVTTAQQIQAVAVVELAVIIMPTAVQAVQELSSSNTH
jgi:hypothetical protein